MLGNKMGILGISQLFILSQEIGQKCKVGTISEKSQRDIFLSFCICEIEIEFFEITSKNLSFK